MSEVSTKNRIIWDTDSINMWILADETCHLKVKISEPVDGRPPDFSEKCINVRQPYCDSKVHWSVKNS